MEQARRAASPVSPAFGYIEVRGEGDTKLTPKDELLALLTFGAEVEHALLVQYLYAFASLDISTGSPATNALRSTLLTVAKQEMGHFITVQNLLLALGDVDAVHIGRDVVRPTNRENPLPFSLEPITTLILKEFILVESPDPDLLSSEVLKKRLADLKTEVWQAAQIEPHRVGDFYLQVYWLLQAGDAPQGKLTVTADPAHGRVPGRHITAADFIDPAKIAPFQATFNEWHGNQAPSMIIVPVGDATTPLSDLANKALDLIYSVMQQGEGAAEGDDSHFSAFLAAFDGLQAGDPKLLPIARTPYTGDVPNEAKVSHYVEDHYSQLWAILFDLRYTMLLLDIGMSLKIPTTNPDRKTLVQWAFSDMAQLNNLMIQLSSKTLTDLGPCGPTFGLLVDELTDDERNRWLRYQELVRQERATIEAVKTQPLLDKDPKGKSLLAKLDIANTARSTAIAQILGRPAPAL